VSMCKLPHKKGFYFHKKYTNRLVVVTEMQCVFWEVGSLARSQICEKRLLPSSCTSVRPHGTTRVPLDQFSWCLISECFSKICRENSSFIKIWQK